jgi:hypothetical protein
MKPKLLSCDTVPELDPYHRDTCGESYTVFFIDRENGDYGLRQDYDDNFTLENEWNGRCQTAILDIRPDEGDAGTYLSSNDCIALVKKVLTGFTIEWDGHNHVGYLTDDAQQAYDEIVSDINNLTESPWQVVNTEYWLNDLMVDDISAEMSEDDVKQLAKNYEDLADVECVILCGDVELVCLDFWRYKQESYQN